MAFRIIAGKKLLVATAGAMAITYANGCFSSGNLVVGPCEEDPDGCGPGGSGGQGGGTGGSGGSGGQGTGGEVIGGQGGAGGEGGAVGEGGAGGADG